MINWNEVKVGETEICRAGERTRKVLAVFDDWVWLKDLSGSPCTYYKKSLAHWTIYDPWEDVSEECHISQYGAIMHGDQIVSTHQLISGRYKRSEKGLRVWKRKEGDG